MRRQRFPAKSRRIAPASPSVEPLESRVALDMKYVGGAVMPAVHVQNIYLGADWADASNQVLAAEKNRFEQFSQFIVKSSYMTMLSGSGYGVGPGTSEPGVVLPLALDKTKVLDDAAIRFILLGQISAQGSKVNGSPDANTLYMIYLEPGVVTKIWSYDSVSALYGWHAAFAGKTRAGDPVDIRYAVMPHTGGPNLSAASWPVNTDTDMMTLTASHELAEAATDPDGNYKKIGWYRPDNGDEIGDVEVRRAITLGGFCVQDMVDQQLNRICPAGWKKYVYSPPIARPKNQPTPRLVTTPGVIAGVSPAAALPQAPAGGDVAARLGFGRLAITGAAAGSRFLRIGQDAADPTLLDVEPLAGSTVNGSAAVWKVPFASIPQGITVTLNSGSGANTATTLWVDTGTATVAGNVSVTVNGDGNSAVTASGAIRGRFAVTTGAGDDAVELSSLRVGAATVVDTGAGADAVSLRGCALATASIVERGVDNRLVIDQTRSAGLTIDQRGAASNLKIGGLEAAGDVSVRQAAGRQLVGVEHSTVGGTLTVRAGSTPDASSLMFADDTVGSLVVRGGNGGYAIQANALDVRGDVTIALGNGNSDVGIFGTVRVGGATSITVGAGNSAVGIVGFPGEMATPKASVFGRIGIVMGKGDTAVAINNLSATALSVRTASPSAFVGIGGPITVPVLKGDLYGFSGTTFAGGLTKITGEVSVARTAARW